MIHNDTEVSSCVCKERKDPMTDGRVLMTALPSNSFYTRLKPDTSAGLATVFTSVPTSVSVVSSVRIPKCIIASGWVSNVNLWGLIYS